MIIDMTCSAVLERVDKHGHNDEVVGNANAIWREWNLEQYGTTKCPSLDKASAIITAALSDDRMRNILRSAVCSEIHFEVAEIIDEYEKTNKIDVAAVRIATLDKEVRDRRRAPTAVREQND